jgi:crotonobetainyl-CoA:carnitine CoA-transferase CaiB-like acyl-CoA transferase
MLGQHTREVLGELGYTSQQVEELIAAKVVKAAD